MGYDSANAPARSDSRSRDSRGYRGGRGDRRRSAPKAAPAPVEYEDEEAEEENDDIEVNPAMIADPAESAPTAREWC